MNADELNVAMDVAFNVGLATTTAPATTTTTTAATDPSPATTPATATASPGSRTNTSTLSPTTAVDIVTTGVLARRGDAMDGTAACGTLGCASACAAYLSVAVAANRKAYATSAVARETACDCRRLQGLGEVHEGEMLLHFSAMGALSVRIVADTAKQTIALHFYEGEALRCSDRSTAVVAGEVLGVFVPEAPLPSPTDSCSKESCASLVICVAVLSALVFLLAVGVLFLLARRNARSEARHATFRFEDVADGDQVPLALEHEHAAARG